MSSWLKKSAAELSRALQAGEVTATELTQASLDRIADLNPTLNAFITVDAEGALATAAEVDRIRAEGGGLHPYAGIPIAIKDNIVTEGLQTTAASKILEGWAPPYDATVIARLKEALVPIVGKTNLDEFAMGSTTETSAFGTTLNSWDTSLVSGGSGGGSAVAVSSYMVPWALGSDTGGSIRQPSSFTGTVGAKPTYGAVSRHGAIALGSSLDQIGPVARVVADAAVLQDLISGHDPKDATSLPQGPSQLEQVVEETSMASAKGLRVGVVDQFASEGADPAILANFEATLDDLRQAGAEIVPLSLPSLEYAYHVYYIVMSAEVFSNLGRMDGVRFGQRFLPEDQAPTAAEMTATTRAEGLGYETKRRVLLGAWTLSHDQHDDYYMAGLRTRTLIANEMREAFQKVDVILSPTTASVAYPVGLDIRDPLAMGMLDAATIPANLVGAPAASVPTGVNQDGLPTAVEVLAAPRGDATVYKVAALVEELGKTRVVTPPWHVK